MSNFVGWLMDEDKDGDDMKRYCNFLVDTLDMSMVVSLAQ